VELPYTAASRCAAWRLLWTMHQRCVTMSLSDVTATSSGDVTASRDRGDVTPTAQCSLTVDECRQRLAGLSCDYFSELTTDNNVCTMV